MSYFRMMRYANFTARLLQLLLFIFFFSSLCTQSRSQCTCACSHSWWFLYLIIWIIYPEIRTFNRTYSRTNNLMALHTIYAMALCLMAIWTLGYSSNFDIYQTKSFIESTDKKCFCTPDEDARIHKLIRKQHQNPFYRATCFRHWNISA